jgi:hypothetical protein
MGVSVTAGAAVTVTVGTIGFGEATRVAVLLTGATGVTEILQDVRMNAVTRPIPISLRNIFLLLIMRLLLF